MPPASTSVPDYREWSLAAVRLLQGVVYSEEERAWTIILGSRSQLEPYFARIGLSLVIDEPEGYAYLRQWDEDDRPEGYEDLPRLVRRTQLGYAPTLLAVLLRDEFRRFEEDDLHNERCVIETDVLLEQWKPFFPSQRDDVRQRRDLLSALRKLEELSFVRQFTDDPQSWEVRRVLKARLPASELESLKQHLVEALTARSASGAEERIDE
jgi:hypothetical protein